MSHINQAEFTVVNYSIEALSTMATALNGEQFPVNDKNVEAIVDSFIDGPLLQPVEVTVYLNTAFLTGGRNRVAALTQEYDGDLDYNVSCLEYHVNSADELLARIYSSNGSRRMTAGEKKAMTTASKFGFGAMSVESLINTLPAANTVAERLDLFTQALGLQLIDTYEMTQDTGLIVARSIVTALKKMKVVINHAAQVDTDGTVLTSASVENRLWLENAIMMDSSDVEDLLSDIVNTIDYAKATSVELPAKVYSEALLTGLNMVQPDVQATVSTKGVATYFTSVCYPLAWQRNAAKWMKVMTPVYRQYLSEVQDVQFK